MRRILGPVAAALAVSAVFSGLTPSAHAAVTSLIPHRATYDLELSASRSGSNVVGASGEMEYQWTDVCDGWAMEQRARIRITYSSGDQFDFGWSMTTWEAREGNRYRFFVRRFSNRQETESIRGSARLDGEDGGEAIYQEPEERRVELPAGTLFPTVHTQAVIDSFEADEVLRLDTVFDGSGEEGLFEISSVRAQSYEAGQALPGEWDLIADQPSWRGLFAFFLPENVGAQPEHEQILRLFANGVVSHLTLDYGEFTMHGGLDSLERLEPPDC